MKAFLKVLLDELQKTRTAPDRDSLSCHYHISTGLMSGALTLEHIDALQYARLSQLSVSALIIRGRELSKQEAAA